MILACSNVDSVSIRAIHSLTARGPLYAATVWYVGEYDGYDMVLTQRDVDAWSACADTAPDAPAWVEYADRLTSHVDCSCDRCTWLEAMRYGW